jgi:cytochrome c-type biogenesis protein CcmH
MAGARKLPALLAVLCLAVAPAASAAQHRAALVQIERQVMCVTCKIPLNVAQSPQADRERAYIQSLIDEGKDEAQVKRALVAQYGSTVLGLPADHGFGVAAYLVPLAAVLLLAGILAVLLPRWRRRTRGGKGDPPPSPLAPADAARLESDLARFD